jgi:hypothetical protein
VGTALLAGVAVASSKKKVAALSIKGTKTDVGVGVYAKNEVGKLLKESTPPR